MCIDVHFSLIVKYIIFLFWSIKWKGRCGTPPLERITSSSPPTSITLSHNITVYRGPVTKYIRERMVKRFCIGRAVLHWMSRTVYEPNPLFNWPTTSSPAQP